MQNINYNFTGNQWLLIDLASMFGNKLDKQLFPVRLDWGRNLLPVIKASADIKSLTVNLSHWINTADEPEMFCACAIAIFDSINNKPSGYMVGLDAASSGPQLLSLLTRCEVGMRNTGAIGNIVPDLYSTILANIEGFVASRKEVKDATVPHIYGSVKAPLKVFGADHYPMFQKSCLKTMPRAEWAKMKLLDAWNEEALVHEWVCPDGATAHIRVIDTEDTVGKFGKFSYTYRHDINRPKKQGKKGTLNLAANVTHSYDGYVLRELHRRCNYDQAKVMKAIAAIEHHLEKGSNFCNLKLRRLSQLAMRYDAVSIVALDHIRKFEMADIPTDYLIRLREQLLSLQEYTPFHLRTIHDEFACAPNNCTRMKYIFSTILVEAYKSTWLMDVIEDLTGERYHHYLPAIDPTVVTAIQRNTYSIN